MADTHPNTRLETFCDGVFAIALTLLIIDIKIPSSEVIGTSREMWLALGHLVPSVLAFVVSFTIIFITWVNHHAAFRLVNKSSASFIFANGFLLLTVVFMPFPTALVGEYLLTDHAAPAVVIYNAVTAMQAVGWILVAGAALRSQLTKDEKSTVVMRDNRRNGYFAFRGVFPSGTHRLLVPSRDSRRDNDALGVLAGVGLKEGIAAGPGQSVDCGSRASSPATLLSPGVPFVIRRHRVFKDHRTDDPITAQPRRRSAPQ